jgi:hypothetical protein
MTGLDSPVSTLISHTPIVPVHSIAPVTPFKMSPDPLSVIDTVSAGMPSLSVIVIVPNAGNRLADTNPATAMATFIVSLFFILSSPFFSFVFSFGLVAYLFELFSTVAIKPFFRCDYLSQIRTYLFVFGTCRQILFNFLPPQLSR